MPLRNLLKKKKKKEEEFVEYGEEAFKEEKKTRIKIENLGQYAETAKIQQLVREGYVVILRIKELREKDINELKKAVDKMKKTVEAWGGDIVGVDEDYLVLTPGNVQIYGKPR